MTKKYASLSTLDYFLGLIKGNLVPNGAIIIWSGKTTNIPGGWHLCDGTNGTPDLRNRFVLGAGSSYSVDNYGGEEEHTLTIEEMPSHSHKMESDVHNNTSITNTKPYYGTLTPDESVIFYQNDDNYETSKSGGSKSHNNMPPYYALCYIMKI